MAAAGQGGLDPRQVKAREEFQRMREQLRRTLERTGEPAPWRERAATPDFAEFRKETRRVRPRLGARSRRGKLMGAIGLGAGAFAAGALVAAAATWIVTRQGQPVAVEVEPAAAAPVVAEVAAPGPPASRVTLSNFELRRAPVAEREVVVQAAVETAPPAVVAPAAAAPAPAVEEAPARFSLTLAEPEASSGPEPVDAAPVEAAEITATVTEVGDADTFELVTLEEPAGAEDLVPVAPEPSVPAAAAPAASGDPVVARILRIREIQSLLAAQGYDVGRADGDAGPQTQRAAEAFASSQGLADANLDAALLALLRATRAGVTMRPPVETNPVIVSVRRVREAQGLLNALGYDVGRPDGDAGPQTLAAVASFASSNSLADANIDDALLALLRERAAQ